MQQLAHGEQADQHRHEMDAVGQFVNAEGEAFDPGGEVDARGADEIASVYAGVNGETIRVGLATAEIIKYANSHY